MQVLYNETLEIDLMRYGIQIPHAGHRATDVLNTLLNHPVHGERQRTWLKQIDPDPIDDSALEGIHSPAWIECLREDPNRAIATTYDLDDPHGRPAPYQPETAQLPLSELRDQLLRVAAATGSAMRHALREGDTFLLCGDAGMPHAMAYGGRGGSLVNDVIVGLSQLLRQGELRDAWVVDVSAYKGCGTAALTQHEARIKTLSIHMARGWPLNSTQYDGSGNIYPWFIPSDVDLGVPESHQHLYHRLLAGGLETLEAREAGRTPDLAVIVCGAESYEKDALPSASLLQLSREQLFERNDFLWRYFRQRQIPSVWLMAGGSGSQGHVIYSDFLQASLTSL